MLQPVLSDQRTAMQGSCICIFCKSITDQPHALVHHQSLGNERGRTRRARPNIPQDPTTVITLQARPRTFPKGEAEPPFGKSDDGEHAQRRQRPRRYIHPHPSFIHPRCSDAAIFLSTSRPFTRSSPATDYHDLEQVASKPRPPSSATWPWAGRRRLLRNIMSAARGAGRGGRRRRRRTGAGRSGAKRERLRMEMGMGRRER